MKKLLAFLVLLLLVACSAPTPSEPAAPSQAVSPEPVVAAPSEPVVSEPEENKPVLADDTAKRLAEEQAKRIAEEIQHVPKLPARERVTIAGEMLNTYSKVDGYKFKTAKALVYVRGDKARMLLYKAVNKRNIMQGTTRYPEIFIDEVIIDRARKTAVGYCFGFTEDARNECGTLKITGIAFNISYDEFYVKAPDDWLREYLNEQTLNEEYEKYFVNDIETVRAEYANGVQIYYFPKIGLPLRIVKGPLDIISYENVVVGQTMPEDVIHRARETIPSEETFYKPDY